MRPLELVTVCGISVSLNFGESARIMKLGVRAAHLMRLGLRRLAAPKERVPYIVVLCGSAGKLLLPGLPRRGRVLRYRGD